MAGYLNLPTDAERNYQKRIVDSQGQAGPTLQRIADRAKIHKNNTGMLEAMFEAVSPMAMYSGEAEGAHIPSKAMQNAQGLAKVFQDWYKTGTPTINVPYEKWSSIIKSGKFKNQMELAGKNHPEAWKQRIEVEKTLGGFPYPQRDIVTQHPYTEYPDDILNKIKMLKLRLNALNNGNYPWHKIESTYNDLTDQLMNLEKMGVHKKLTTHEPEYSEKLAKKNPVYGHIYNPKYTHEGTATGFGNTHAEMSDLVKEQSKYVLGDSFHPFVKTAFSSDDMLGNTSRLERALFNRVKKPFLHMPPKDALKTIKKYPEQTQNLAQYMEMWVPNHLARLNNVKGVYVPSNVFYKGVDRAVPAKEVPKLTKWTDLDIMQGDMDNLVYKQRLEEEINKFKSGESKFSIDDEIPF